MHQIQAGCTWIYLHWSWISLLLDESSWSLLYATSVVMVVTTMTFVWHREMFATKFMIKLSTALMLLIFYWTPVKIFIISDQPCIKYIVQSLLISRHCPSVHCKMVSIYKELFTLNIEVLHYTFTRDNSKLMLQLQYSCFMARIKQVFLTF